MGEGGDGAALLPLFGMIRFARYPLDIEAALFFRAKAGTILLSGPLLGHGFFRLSGGA